jgi:hypothetical protein
MVGEFITCGGLSKNTYICHQKIGDFTTTFGKNPLPNLHIRDATTLFINLIYTIYEKCKSPV